MADNASAAPAAASDASGLSDVAQEFLSQSEAEQDAVLEPVGDDAAGKDTKAKPASAPRGVKAKSGGLEEEAEIPEEAPDEGGDDLADEVGGRAEAKKWKLKANGKEYEVDSEDKLVAAAQRGIAAEQNWQKARSEIEALKSNFQRKLEEMEAERQLVAKDPAAFVKKYNDKAEDIMEQILLDRAKEAMAMEEMTPRERQLYQQNKQYQERLNAQEANEKKANEAKETELVEQQKRQIGDVFAKALTEAKIPANPYTVRVMAAVYRAALSRGVELNADQAAKLTKKQLDEAYTASAPAIKDMPAAEFVAQYPELTESIRKHLVAQAKGARVVEPSDVPRKPNGQFGKPQQKSKPADQGKSWDDYVERLKKEGSALRVKNGWF